jgi:hypothetical protein
MIYATIVWMTLNTSYVLISSQIMHHCLLKEEQWRWYREDVGLPLVSALIVAGFVTSRYVYTRNSDIYNWYIICLANSDGCGNTTN